MSAPFRFDVGAVTGATSTVQLCRTGSFYRADQGRFKVTRGMLEAMVANAQERGVDLPLKLTHEGNTLAAGWVPPSTLSVRPWRTGYGLFGSVTWAQDEALLSALRAGRSKYISPEIVWRDTRMAASPRGHAGEPIGPSLVGAALVLDPFFSMDAVQFSRFASRLAAGLAHKPQRYAMDQGMIDKVKDVLKDKGMAEESLDGAVLALMMALSGGSAEQPSEPMPAEATPEAKPEEEELPYDKAAPAIAAARVAQFDKMAKRLAELEAKDKAREAKENDALFSEFSLAGRLRFADKDEAKKLLEQHGPDAFKAAYGRVPALEQPAPKQTAALPTAKIGEALEQASNKTGAPVVNADKAVPVEAIRKYMRENGVTAAKAATALSRAAK
jgi:hypothetical protein